jgi:hypothetical protein
MESDALQLEHESAEFGDWPVPTSDVLRLLERVPVWQQDPGCDELAA